MWNKFVLISKFQLNNDVNSKVNFRKMRVPLLCFTQKFYTNPKLTILRDFAEGFFVNVWQGSAHAFGYDIKRSSKI